MDFEKGVNPDEIRRFLQNKLGSNVQVEVFPQTQQDDTDEGEPSEKSQQAALEFPYKPSDIKAYLDRFVIRQEEAKKVLATAICDHYHHLKDSRDEDLFRDYKKQNILLIGPTGVGKTYLIQNIARLIGVPFVKADATKYSETGYVGGDVEDLVRELVAQADGDVELAEKGIVYLDEVDKLASPNNVVGRDVSGHGVQRNLLKLMEETEVPLRSPTDIASQMQSFMEFQSKGKVEKKTINTRHILFIASGAFNGLPEIIKRRIGSKQIGFTGEKTPASEEQFLMEQVKSVDLLEFGFEAEFVGRLPVVVNCLPLTAQDMFDILKHSEGSILKQYKRDFLAYDIDTYFTDDGMEAIAEAAAKEQTGARGLMTVCEKLFRDFKYTLPDADVKAFVIDEELVKNPAALLAQLLDTPSMFEPRVGRWQLKRLEEGIQNEFNLNLVFTLDAVEELEAQSEKADQELVDYTRELLNEFHHAFKLLSQTGGDKKFVLDRVAVRNPEITFENWIREGYRQQQLEAEE